MKAPEFCERAAALMRERGEQYDKPEGERSMARTVAAFNAVTGRDLTEPEGWLLMLLLKQVRQWQTPGRYHADSAEDGVAYSALLAEALAAGPKLPLRCPGTELPGVAERAAAIRAELNEPGVVAKVARLPLLPIVVGAAYRRRDGKEARVIEKDDSPIPFKGSDGFWRHANGTYLGGLESNLDLIERIA